MCLHKMFQRDKIVQDQKLDAETFWAKTEWDESWDAQFWDGDTTEMLSILSETRR